MSLRNSYLFTSEAVSEGHPDKLCDQISDAVLDAVLAHDPRGHVACETLATTDFVILAGEIQANIPKLDYDGIVRRVVDRIGYNREGEGFCAKTLKTDIRLHAQSADIARGVSSDTSLLGEQGAGDQGIMFGYACSETPEFMPAPIYYSQRILEELARVRRQGEEFAFLRPDAKSQLTFAYENGKPVAIRQIVVSHQHTEGSNEKVQQVVKDALKQVLPAEFLTGILWDKVNSRDGNLYINPTGNFVTGGPDGDSGLTGRKIIVDTYGGTGRHGGGAFSGKDPSKVDRSACYMMRHIAKNLVAAGAAERCEIQVSYAIGIPDPLSFNVNFFGTGKVSEEKVEELLNSRKVFDCRPAQIINYLGLLQPQGWSYEETASYGHFGRPQFPWEKLNKVEELKDALNL